MNYKVLEHLSTCKNCTLDSDYCADTPVVCIVCGKELRDRVPYIDVDWCNDVDFDNSALCLECSKIKIVPFTIKQTKLEMKEAMEDFKRKISKHVG
jgi:hypothetical protein